MKSFDDKSQRLATFCAFSGSRVIPGGRRLTVKICRTKNVMKSDKSTQTDYRESEAQTVPWTPEVVFRQRGIGQHLAKEWLALGEDTPLNLDRVVLIERARQRQAWEDSIPRSRSRKQEFCRLSCVAAIAMNEANFRETLIEVEHKERLRLSEENLKGIREQMLLRLKSRVEKRRQENCAANFLRVKNWNQQLRRRMRKLVASTTKLSDTLKRDRLDRFIIKDLESRPYSYRLDVDVSAMREDTHEGAARYLAEFKGIELLEKQIVVPLPQEFQVSKKSKPGNFCSRIVRDTEKKVESFHFDEEGSSPFF